MSHDLGTVTIFRVRLGVSVRVRFRVWIGVKFKIEKNTKLQILKIITLPKT
jgi:hypothetical protein